MIRAVASQSPEGAIDRCSMRARSPRSAIALLASGALLCSVHIGAEEQAAESRFDGVGPEDIEEVLVTAPAPRKGRTPALEYVIEVYDARRRGADLYKRGRYAEAFPYLLVAAKRGFKFAQARVGFLYQQGIGTEQDPQAAIGWLGVAARGETMPEIRNHFNDLWRKIPEEYRPGLEAVIDEFEDKYGAQTNRVACDLSHKAGTFIRKLTCRFMDEHLYSQTGEVMSEVTAFEVPAIAGAPGGD